MTRSRGFTILEIAVVASILLALLSIALPVYAGARREASRTSCIARLRQIGMGMNLYRELAGGTEVGTPIQMGFPPIFFGPDEMSSALGGPRASYIEVMRCSSPNGYPEGKPNTQMFIGLWPPSAGIYANQEAAQRWMRYVSAKGSSAVYLVDLNHQASWPVTTLAPKRALGLALDGSVITKRKIGAPDDMSWWY